MSGYSGIPLDLGGLYEFSADGSRCVRYAIERNASKLKLPYPDLLLVFEGPMCGHDPLSARRKGVLGVREFSIGLERLEKFVQLSGRFGGRIGNGLLSSDYPIEHFRPRDGPNNISPERRP
jgi:hypothetical protein